MKKLFIFIVVAAVVVLPYLLPMPFFVSNLHNQYALGDTMTFDISAWNISPIPRAYDGEAATNVVLKIDGQPLVTTETPISHEVRSFSRVDQTVSYTISKQASKQVGFDETTRQIELPAGRHDITVEWLGSTAFSKNVSFTEI